MDTLRDIRNRARRDIHAGMAVPALYLHGSDDPLPVTVRLHTKFHLVGDVAAMRDSPAQVQEIIPRIVFSVDEISTVRRNAVVSIETGEAYNIDNPLPADGTTITAEVHRLDATDAAGLPVP